MAQYPPISGFTVIRNAQLMGYPVLESIQSLLPLVDEMVVGVGQSDDQTKDKTKEMIASLNDPKIKLFDSFWDTQKTKGGLVLSEKTNEALSHCQNDWCFYLQADELLHEEDHAGILSSISEASLRNRDLPPSEQIEGLLFKYIHFYGSYQTIATSRRWYRNEICVIRKSSGARSHNDAQGFRINGSRKLRVLSTPWRIFHYGWVKPPEMMGQKSKLLNRWWHGAKRDNEFNNFNYDRQYGLKEYRGSHPAIMGPLVAGQDWKFDFQRRLSDWTLKDLNLLASDCLESLTGYRIGEYRPYQIVTKKKSTKPDRTLHGEKINDV